MDEWADIRITGRDKERSAQPTNDDSELSRQVFTLSDMPSPRWTQICNAFLIAQVGRFGGYGEPSEQTLSVWGGPNVFTESDANHLKEPSEYVNRRNREPLVPPDLSGLDAFDRCRPFKTVRVASRLGRLPAALRY